MIWIISLLLAFASAKESRPRHRAKPQAAPAVTKFTKVGTCRPAKPIDKSVMVVKQWHLAPTTITKGFKEKYPQEKNQTAIYKAISDMVKKGQIDLLVAEGCEGEIDENFNTAFNGWTLEDLAKQSQTKGYDKIISHVPLKIEARWGKKISTICGDDEKLIQEGNLHLSNLRGWVGYLSRLSDSSLSEERIKPYAEAAADVLKMPKDSPIPELKKEIQKRTETEIDLFSKTLKDRNANFVKTLQSHEFKSATIVIGGLHADDLRNELEQAGFSCDIYEPPGYSRADESLIQEFQRNLKNR